MDYKEYKAHLETRDLIESTESIQCLVDAIQLIKNIRTIKSLSDSELALYGSFDLNPQELLEDFEERKNSLFRTAIKLCYSKDDAFEKFGKVYKFQVKEMIKNFPPQIAVIGRLDLQQQRGEY